MAEKLKDAIISGYLKAIEDNEVLKKIADEIKDDADVKAPVKPTKEYQKGFDHGIKYAMKFMEYFAKNAESKWIPCSKALPSLRIRYLVIREINENSMFIDFAMWSGLLWEKEGVRYWMPLPELPQGEEYDNSRVGSTD